LGHEISVIDCLSSGVNHCPEGAEFWREDLNKLREPLRSYDVVVHAAATADIKDNWKGGATNRRTLERNNIHGTINLLERATARVVFLSTCAVYGDDNECREDIAVQATSPYAASKLSGEALVQAYAHARGQDWHVLRLSTTVGPRYHHGHIRDFVDGARNGGVKPMTSGFGKKSYVHVHDVATAVAMAVSGELKSGIYNVASGVWSPRETVHEMGLRDVPWVEAERGWIGDPICIAQSHKLISQGWGPRYGVAQGVREALGGLGWAPK
jgi:nucleoside-diphosphate-sugar epimerase